MKKSNKEQVFTICQSVANHHIECPIVSKEVIVDAIYYPLLELSMEELNKLFDIKITKVDDETSIVKITIKTKYHGAIE